MWSYLPACRLQGHQKYLPEPQTIIPIALPLQLFLSTLDLPLLVITWKWPQANIDRHQLSSFFKPHLVHWYASTFDTTNVRSTSFSTPSKLDSSHVFVYLDWTPSFLCSASSAVCAAPSSCLPDWCSDQSGCTAISSAPEHKNVTISSALVSHLH